MPKFIPEQTQLLVLNEIIVTHRSGTLGHMALIEHVAKKLHHVTTAQTTLDGDNLVEAGRTTIFHELEVQVRVLS